MNMKWLFWLFNPFATIDNPYLPSRPSRLSWKARRWIIRIVWLGLILGGTTLFHAGVELACQQLPDVCVRGQGRPNMAFVWVWSISLTVAGWIIIDLMTWILAPSARPRIRIRRRSFGLPALLIALLGLPQSSFAWSSGKCDWTNTVACLENQMVNVGLIINVAIWNMFNRPLLIGARMIERLREILVETFFRDALNGILAGVWPYFWISVAFALLFYAGTYALRLIVRWDVVDLQQLGVTIFLAFIFFGMGGLLLNANENIRIQVGQGFQGIAADMVSNTTTNFSTIVANDGSMLPPKNIYASEVCGGDTTIKRSINATMLSDYTARFLRADAVDIHCPIEDPNQYGFVSVPTHLGPGPSSSQDDIYPPSTTGAYDASPSEEEAFLFYYLEPNIQYRVFNAEEATAEDRERLFSRSMDGMYIQIQAIPLGIMSIFEQTLYLVFAFCSFGVWLAICLSLVFAPFIATNGIFTGQLLNLVNIAKTSWVSSFWMGVLLGFFKIGAERGASLIVFVTGLGGIVLILGLLAQAGSLFKRTVLDGAGSVLGSAPRATAGAFKSLGGGVKTVASSITAGIIAKRMTGDNAYAGGAAMGQSKTMRRIAQGAAMAGALVTGKSPTDNNLMMGINSSRSGDSPFDWYSLKRHSANKAKVERNAQEANLRDVGADRPQSIGTTARQQGHYEALNDPRRSTVAGSPVVSDSQNGGTPKPIRDTTHPIHQILASDGITVDRQRAGHFLDRGYVVQDIPGSPQMVKVVKPWNTPAGKMRDMEARRRELDFEGVPIYRGRGEPANQVSPAEAKDRQRSYVHQSTAEQNGETSANSANGLSSVVPKASQRQLKRVSASRAIRQRPPAPSSMPTMVTSQSVNGTAGNTLPTRRQRPPAHRFRSQPLGASSSSVASSIPSAVQAVRRQQRLSPMRTASGENMSIGRNTSHQQRGRPQKVQPSRERMVAAQRGRVTQSRQTVVATQRSVVSAPTKQPMLNAASHANPTPQRGSQPGARRVVQRSLSGTRQRVERQSTTVVTQPIPLAEVKTNAKSNMKSNPQTMVVLPPTNSETPEGETSHSKAIKRTINRPRY